MNKKMFLSLILASVMGVASVSAHAGCASTGNDPKPEPKEEAGRLTRYAQSAKELVGSAVTYVQDSAKSTYELATKDNTNKAITAAIAVATVVGVVAVVKAVKASNTTEEEVEETEDNFEAEETSVN